ncbi:MAG: aspartate/glutamate racemase family protein [Alphaproteobacteria bacterium]|nr:aspartate/glutamate racemase family protein [Alphaproteobacteria bacterium]
MKIGIIGTAFRRNDPLAIPEELAKVLAPGSEAAVYAPALSAFPHNPFDLKLQEIGYIEAGLRAAADGCGAIVLNTVGDYGAAALKSAVRVPVAAAGEVGLHVAASLGRPVGIVTIWPESTRFLYRSVIRESGLEAAVASVLHVGSESELAGLGAEDDYIARMQQADRDVVSRIIAACRKAQRDGAASILLGCTCMSPIAAEVAAALDIPVVNPLTVVVKYAELMASLGIRQSSACYAAANPARRPALAAMAAAGAAIVGAADCEVCLVGE